MRLNIKPIALQIPKEGDDRKEEKLDFIIKKLDPENSGRLLQEWETKYPKK